MSTEINPNLSESPKNILKVLEETLPPISNNSKSKSDIINQIQIDQSINNIIESPKKKLIENNDSIKTFCRIRPFNGTNLLFHRSKTDSQILNINSENLQKLNINTNLKLINSYKFTKVFTEENTQIEIFNETCKKLIDDLVFNFKSGLIFTYGMTNAGKTFTVIGSPNNPGILPQSLILLFDYYQNNKLNDFNLFCNFVEIYNEEVFDLLSNDELGKNKFYKKKLNVKENLNNIFYLQDVTFQKLSSLKDFNDSLNLGISKKVHSSTTLNQNSSRSHTIFKIILKKENENNNFFDQEISLSIVDLAGSERAKRTDTSGKELQEACKINQSLSILGKCLESMKHNSIYTNKKLVPFRESKLTKLFCEYFQGDQNIIMITNINPRKEDFEESIRALNYSCLAKDIRPVKSVLNINNKNTLKLINKKKDNCINKSNNNLNEDNNVKDDININKNSEDIKNENNNLPLDYLSRGEYIINNDNLKTKDEKSNLLTVRENYSVENSDIQKLITEIQNLRSEVLGFTNSNISNSNNNKNTSTSTTTSSNSFISNLFNDLNDNSSIKNKSINQNLSIDNNTINNNNQNNFPYNNHFNYFNPYIPHLPNNNYYNNNSYNNIPLLPSPYPIKQIRNDYPQSFLERQINESLNLIPPQAKNSGLNLIFINSRFSDFHMGKNGPILEEDENESEDEEKQKKKRNNNNNNKKPKRKYNKNPKNNKKQKNGNNKNIKDIYDSSNDNESKQQISNLYKNRNMSTPIRNYNFDKSEEKVDIIQSKILINDNVNNITTPSKQKKNSNDLFQTVPNNKYKGLFEDFMF